MNGDLISFRVITISFRLYSSAGYIFLFLLCLNPLVLGAPGYY